MRKDIDRLDRDILRALGQRFRIVKKLSLLKKDLNWPVLQKKRKNEIKKTRVKAGLKMGLNSSFVNKIFTTIQAESVAIQRKDRS